MSDEEKIINAMRENAETPPFDEEKPSTTAIRSNCEHNHGDMQCATCPEESECRPATAVHRASSQEAYLTTVTISRYNDRATEDMRAGIEDEYSFEIGLRTFPDVLRLVDEFRKVAGG